MQIAILGTGRMARGIAFALKDTPHGLTLASREPPRAEALAREMSEEHARRFHGAGLEAASSRADVAFLAVPWSAALVTVRALREALDGRVLVDLTNPLNASHDGLEGEPTSAATAAATARVVASDVALVEGAIRARVAVRLQGGAIVEAGDREAMERGGESVLDLGRRAMLPGTVNAHNHSFQSLLRGFGDDLP